LLRGNFSAEQSCLPFNSFGKQKNKAMKNYITQLSLVVIAVVGLTFLMSYARAAGEEPKQYMVVYGEGSALPKIRENLQMQVNQKISEGWHLQGGVSVTQVSTVMQAMVK
jgi:hypothetical protein